MQLNIPKGIEVRRDEDGRPTGMRMAFMYKGDLCRETIKLDVTPANLKVAERWRNAILHEIGIGTFVYETHFPNSKRAKAQRPGSSVTVAQALRAWLDENKTVWRYSTWLDFRNMVENILIPEFGTWTMDELAESRTKILAWRNALTCGPKRANNLLIPLRAVCEDAFCDEQIEKNPMQRIRNLEFVNKEADPYDPAEVSALLEAIPEGQDRNYIQFAFGAGLQTGEQIGFEWPSVDWRQSSGRIDKSVVRNRDDGGVKTKYRVRNIRLLQPAIESLQAQRSHTQLIGGKVFYNHRKARPWRNPGEITEYVWVPAHTRSGVRYRNLYQTRHTFASTALMGGFPELRGMDPMALIMWLARHMGHKDASMIFEVYGKYISGLGLQPAQTVATIG